MRNRLGDFIAAMILAWVIPWFVFGICSLKCEAPASDMLYRETSEHVVQPERCIRVLSDNAVTEMELSDYLTGVLLAEMPGSFHLEAKKAQAIVARTYAMRTVLYSDKHNGAICTDSTCCQAYTNPKTYDLLLVEQAAEAVTSTEDLVLLYDGKLIEATYFSCSGGLTEDAVAVWGTEVPYLQSVESPGEEIASVYRDVRSISKKELEQLLAIELSGIPSQWFGGTTYTEGGGVASMRIGNKTWKGTELRSLLGLRSTAFTVEAGDNALLFTTKGYGHRVGMSQYGAQAMALSGKSYDQILLHYYIGTRIESIQTYSIN